MIEKQLTNTASLALVKVHIRKRDRELRKLGCIALPMTQDQLLERTRGQVKEIPLPSAVTSLVASSKSMSTRLLNATEKRLPQIDASMLKSIAL